MKNNHFRDVMDKKDTAKTGIKYCRSCYDHLAGLVGVTVTEALESKGYLEKSGSEFSVSPKGWEWLRRLNISKEDFTNRKRPVTRQCIDWSERRPHLAGQLGASLLKRMLEQKWLERVGTSRVLTITPKGHKELREKLGVQL